MRDIVTCTLTQIVNSGDRHIFIEGHYAAAAPHLTDQNLFFNGVACDLGAVFFAPLVDDLDKILGKQLVTELVVIKSEFLRAFVVYEESQQTVEHVVAVAGLKLGIHHIRPYGMPSVILRLVGKESGHCFAELVTATLLVVLIGCFDEFLCNSGIHGVNVRGIRAAVKCVIFR